jgi:integrase
MLARTESGVEPRFDLARRPLARKHPASQRRAASLPETRPAATAFGRPPVRDRLPALPLRPLIAQYTATFGSTWAPVTRRKHRDDFARLVDYLEAGDLPVTTASLDFLTLVDYVTDLRARPKVRGVWRGAPDALRRSLAAGPIQTLSANSVNAYVRPIRSLAIWLVDEGLLSVNPFRRSRRRAALNPLLPSEETPTKSATLDDLHALERGCAGDRPLDLRDRAIVSILVTTAARNSSVRLLRIGDVDFERAVIPFRRAKGGKTLELPAADNRDRPARLSRSRTSRLPSCFS